MMVICDRLAGWAWHLTFWLLGPYGKVPPNVPVDGICSKPFYETCHGLDTLWPNALPVYKLGICLVLQGLRVCHRSSLEGGQHLGTPCLFPSLPLFGLGLLLLFSLIKGIGGCLDHLI